LDQNLADVDDLSGFLGLNPPVLETIGILSAVEISTVAPDWGVKGAHAHVGNVELAIRPGANGSLVLKPVFSSTSENAVQSAEKVLRKALQDVTFLQQLHDATGRAIELLKHGNDIERARSGELRLLQHALQQAIDEKP
jgi:hypothetical protein